MALIPIHRAMDTMTVAATMAAVVLTAAGAVMAEEDIEYEPAPPSHDG